MSNNCDSKIAVSITQSGCNPVAKGLKSIGYICNFDDIDHANCTRTDGSNLFTNFALKGTAKLYKIYQAGKTPFSGATSEAQVGNYRTTWNKTLPIVILSNGADVTQNIIDKLANGKYCAIVENAYAGTNGDNVFEFVGIETGLVISEGNNEKYNEDYGGGWSLTMQEENAPTSALYLLKSDGIDATRTFLEGLVATTTTSGTSSSSSNG